MRYFPAVTTPGGSGELPPLGMLAAVVSRQASDLALYANFLVAALGDGLPAGHMTVERERGVRARLRRGDPPVTGVSILLGEDRFTLRRDNAGQAPVATLGHEVGGIVLRTETLPLGDWAQRVAVALQAVAARNEASARALADITGFEV
ncbi:MAG: hypothetical protein JWN20_1495 [Jatrophihabitantaceae bacterium]|nr:hypothetical protein [Jatrophihabitantaceae bacterium]